MEERDHEASAGSLGKLKILLIAREIAVSAVGRQWDIVESYIGSMLVLVF